MGQRRSVDKREGHSDFVEEGAAKNDEDKNWCAGMFRASGTLVP